MLLAGPPSRGRQVPAHGGPAGWARIRCLTDEAFDGIS